tara:strand:- start:20637 stop:22064 length:1428 start_codon:yes stop_codon:yes gene_type:complete
MTPDRTLAISFLRSLQDILGSSNVLTDLDRRSSYGVDALGIGRPADAVVLPNTTDQVASVLKLCNTSDISITPRGAGTGYTGGAVPINGGIVLALDHFNKILELDKGNLLAIVQPNVVTGVLQQAVEKVDLFYPPDPASLNHSVIGGNVAECAGGPRAFKYGTTKRYVLGLEAVLASGQIIRTGGKSVKNVVGYDLTSLLVGSEGTLAIVTEIILRLIPRPKSRTTLHVNCESIEQAIAAVDAIIVAGVIPAALELIDGDCIKAMESYQNRRDPSGLGAALLIEVDGMPTAVDEESTQVIQACQSIGLEARTAYTPAERERLWDQRRNLSLALRAHAPKKLNHDVVVPKGRIPQLFEVIQRLKTTYDLQIPSFGHVGDGNIHVNILLDPNNPVERKRAASAEAELFKAVVGLEGSITGEHGIGFSKKTFLELELSEPTIATMRGLKRAFDPKGILNPGKIFPEELDKISFDPVSP